MGKLVFQVTGAFAEFERSIIRQQIKAGLKRAVAEGQRLGRPKVDVVLERKAQKELRKGVGILRVAKTLGLGTGTVQRIKQEMGAAQSQTPGGAFHRLSQRCKTLDHNIPHEATQGTVDPRKRWQASSSASPSTIRKTAFAFCGPRRGDIGTS
jgi:hypothetical protein